MAVAPTWLIQLVALKFHAELEEPVHRRLAGPVNIALAWSESAPVPLELAAAAT